jgi:hypothetical protein
MRVDETRFSAVCAGAWVEFEIVSQLFKLGRFEDGRVPSQYSRL